MVSSQIPIFIFWFLLLEAELEAKVKRIAQKEIIENQLNMKKELDARTKKMRDFVNT